MRAWGEGNWREGKREEERRSKWRHHIGFVFLFLAFLLHWEPKKEEEASRGLGESQRNGLEKGRVRFDFNSMRFTNTLLKTISKTLRN